MFWDVFLERAFVNVSHAFLWTSNAKNGIWRECWMELFCTQCTEGIYGISNSENEAGMSFSHLLRQSRECHIMNKICLQIDKLCMSNLEMRSPNDISCDLVFAFLANCKSAFEGSILSFSKCVLHQTQHLHFGNKTSEIDFEHPNWLQQIS